MDSIFFFEYVKADIVQKSNPNTKHTEHFMNLCVICM